MAVPLFEISPLYTLSKSSSYSSFNSSNSVVSSCCFRNLLIAASSNDLTVILPSPISLKAITVFLSLSVGTKA